MNDFGRDKGTRKENRPERSVISANRKKQKPKSAKPKGRKNGRRN